MTHSSGGMATVAFVVLPFYTTARDDDNNVVAEVITNSPSGEFTSKLTRRNISTGLTGTEIGCSQSQIDQVTCRPSRTDQISSITLNVQSCQGKAWS